MKLGKIKHRESHVAPTKYGEGTSYGTGIKQKVGIQVRDYLYDSTSSNKKYGKPPKSLA